MPQLKILRVATKTWSSQINKQFYSKWNSKTSEGNGTPLQYSCLENPTDGGAWWAAAHGVAQSQTQLKQPSSSSSIETSWRHHHSLGFAGVNLFLGACRAVTVRMLGWAGCCASADTRASLPDHVALGWVCSPPFILCLVTLLDCQLCSGAQVPSHAYRSHRLNRDLTCFLYFDFAIEISHLLWKFQIHMK